MSKTPCPPDPIGASQIQGVFGGSNPIGINEYYGCDSSVPKSGRISYDDLRCIPNVPEPDPKPPTADFPFKTGACYAVTGDSIGNQTGRTCTGIGWDWYPAPNNNRWKFINIGHVYTNLSGMSTVNTCGHTYRVGDVAQTPKETHTSNNARMDFYCKSNANERFDSWYTFAGWNPYQREGGDYYGEVNPIGQGLYSRATSQPGDRAIGTETGIIQLMGGLNITAPHNTDGSRKHRYISYSRRKVNQGDTFTWTINNVIAPKAYNSNVYVFVTAGILHPTDGFSGHFIGSGGEESHGFLQLKSFSAPNYYRYTYSNFWGYCGIEYNNKKDSSGTLVWQAKYDMPTNCNIVIMETTFTALTT